MQLSFVTVRRAMAGAVLAAFVWCGQASAQVMDQIPSTAMGVLKIKSLEKTNAKVAKLAKSFGLDEIEYSRGLSFLSDATNSVGVNFTAGCASSRSMISRPQRNSFSLPFASGATRSLNNSSPDRSAIARRNGGAMRVIS